MIPFRGVPFSLVSPFSPEECAARLREVIAPDTGIGGTLALFSGKSLVGVANAEFARLRRLNAYRNFMQPQLTATLEPYGSGTRLDYGIALPLPSLVLSTIAIVFFSFVALVALLGVARGHADVTNVWPVILAIGFFVGLIGLGRMLARGERESLEATLIELLAARKEY